MSEGGRASERERMGADYRGVGADCDRRSGASSRRGGFLAGNVVTADAPRREAAHVAADVAAALRHRH